MIHVVHGPPLSGRGGLRREQARPVLQVRPVRAGQKEQQAQHGEPARRDQQARGAAPSATRPCVARHPGAHRAFRSAMDYQPGGGLLQEGGSDVRRQQAQTCSGQRLASSCGAIA